MILNYKDLFEPYTKHGHSIEKALKYWAIIAKKNRVPTDVMETVINEVFVSLSNGKVYPEGPCLCGCASNDAATSLVHDVEDRMLKLDSEMTKAAADILSSRFDLVVQEQMKKISKTNKEYIKMNQPPITQRSPVLRGSLKLWRLIFSR